jgi:acyl-CoA synthetase (AMP-forming)/AMP-acid ligase II
MTSGFTLFDAFERAVALHADRPAVHCGTAVWSFRELGDRVRSVAAGLADLPLRPGERVAVLGENCHRYLELYLAAAASGAVVVPIDLRLADAEVRAVLTETSPAVLVGDRADRLERLQGLYGEARASVTLDGDGGPEATRYETLAEFTADVRPPEGLTPDAPIVLFYTAAVAGSPRGAAVTHRNLLTQLSTTGEPLGIGPDDAHGLFLPLSHTFGAYLMFVAACRGAANTVLRSFDADQAAAQIAAGEVTFFAEFAPMATRIVDAAAESNHAFPANLRFVLGLDAPPTIQRYRGASVRWWNFYGQTETTGLVAMGEVTGEDTEPNFVGRPLPLARISLRHSDGQPAPAGEAGEAWVRSDAAVQRYWPDEPTRLTGDGWLRTGDVLRGDAEGRMWFIGRTSDKDLIKSGGLNVYPAEVEQVLEEHPGIARAFVFGMPDPEWRERVCAVVQLAAGGGQLDAEAVAGFCAARIAKFKCPRPEGILVVAADEDFGDDVDRRGVRDRFEARLEAMVGGSR